MPDFYKTIKTNPRFAAGFAAALQEHRQSGKSVTPEHPECPAVIEPSDDSELKKYNPYKALLRKTFYTDNPPISPKIKVVWVLSGRTDQEGHDVDKLTRPFDPTDDIDRMHEGIRVADEVNAMLAGKKVDDLTDADRVTPIFYNGRPQHNEALRNVLQEGKLPYPTHLFEIRDIEKFDTAGQMQCVNSYLEGLKLDPKHEYVAMVTSGFHVRAGLAASETSPFAMDAEGFPNALGQATIIMYTTDRLYKQPGTVDYDLVSEPNAMYNYATGFGGERPPTIAKWQNNSVLSSPADFLTHESFREQVRTGRTRDSGCTVA